MTTIEITRSAKCKDCIFLRRHRYQKKDGSYSVFKTVSKCSNSESPQHEKQITLQDRVCDKWKLF